MKTPDYLVEDPFAGCFADYLCALEPQCHAAVKVAAKLVSAAIEKGHTCINLADHSGCSNPSNEFVSEGSVPDLKEWKSTLQKSCLVGQPGDYRPLILDQSNRLYLARYWQYEKLLATQLLDRALNPVADVDLSRLRQCLERLFDTNSEVPDLQKAAAAASVLQRITIISGGPGTGKTSTVIRILAALIMQTNTVPPRIGLAAPTGKAAARMQHALRTAKSKLRLTTEIASEIPEQVHTIHHLLQSIHLSTHFRHNVNNPLPIDVLVLDEASMIDLALMTKLLQALPSQARLILIGDKDQLGSIEAGAVFRDLCAQRGYTREFVELIDTASGVSLPTAEEKSGPMGNAVMQLQHNYRFDSDSGLGKLAAMINSNRCV